MNQASFDYYQIKQVDNESEQTDLDHPDIRAAVALLRSKLFNIEYPTGVKYGCHVELFCSRTFEPDDCVIDLGKPEDCIYAHNYTSREQCPYWKAYTKKSLEELKKLYSQ